MTGSNTLFSVKQKSRMEIVPVFCDTLAQDKQTSKILE